MFRIIRNLKKAKQKERRKMRLEKGIESQLLLLERCFQVFPTRQKKNGRPYPRIEKKQLNGL